MAFSLVHFLEPPNHYTTVGVYGTTKEILDQLNDKLVDGFVKFNNHTLAGNPEHWIRADQWAIVDSDGGEARLGFEGGKFVIKEEP